MYSLNASLYGSVFVVPSAIVDKYIKMASYCAMKTLLWILKNQGGNFSVSEIAKGVGSSEADVKEALDYWVNEGILVSNGAASADSGSPVLSDSYLLEGKSAKPAEKPKKSEAEASEKTELILPTFEQVTARINESKEIAGLINQTQMMLGRTTGYDMNAKLVQLVDGYGFSVDVILRLIQYCVDISTTSNAFIFSVAKNWYKHEITTLEQADEYIDEHSGAQSVYYQFKLQTGVSAPKATPKQEEYLIKWTKLGFDTEMIVTAYNRTVESIGKINFNYMDKIICGWNEEGIKTPDDIEKAKSNKNNRAARNSSRSYDIDKAIDEAQSDDLVYEKKKKKRGESK